MEATAPRRVDVAGALRLVGWIGLLVAVIVGFGALGRGPLAVPALTDMDAWRTWASGRDPVEGLFAILRVVVVLLAWYLLGVTLLGVVARLLRWGRLVTVADLLTVPAVRRLLQTSLGLGLAGAALTSLQAVPAAEAPAPTAATVALADASADVVVLGGNSYGVMRALDGGDVAVMRAVDEHFAIGAVDQGAIAEVQGDAWHVQPGEHFWGVAEQTLTQAWSRAPSEPETVAYWQQLVEVNRPLLADPGNPDLVYPGQVFTLPAPPPAPA